VTRRAQRIVKSSFLAKLVDRLTNTDFQGRFSIAAFPRLIKPHPYETLRLHYCPVPRGRRQFTHSERPVFVSSLYLPADMSADSQGSDAEDVKGILGGKREKRTSRACLTCRKRKSACELFVFRPFFRVNSPFAH